MSYQSGTCVRETRVLMTVLAPMSVFRQLQVAHCTFRVDAQHQFMVRQRVRNRWFHSGNHVSTLAGMWYWDGLCVTVGSIYADHIYYVRGQPYGKHVTWYITMDGRHLKVHVGYNKR